MTATKPILVVLFLLLSVSGCARSKPLEKGSPVELRCDAIQFAPPEGMTKFAVEVALPAAPRHSALQTSRQLDTNGHSMLFAKTGLWFRGTSAMTISIKKGPSNARLEWGGTGGRAVMTPSNCRGEGEGWQTLIGGYWTEHPACLTLEVSSDGTNQEALIGVGLACPGQVSPPFPSDM